MTPYQKRKAAKFEAAVQKSLAEHAIIAQVAREGAEKHMEEFKTDLETKMKNFEGKKENDA